MRESPGGTCRTAQYTSPSKAEILWELGEDCDDEIVEHELEFERWSRRCSALNKVPGQHSDAQRSAMARSKRAAGVLSAPSKRACGDRKPWGFNTGYFDQQLSLRVAPHEYCSPPTWVEIWKHSGGVDSRGGMTVGGMWEAYEKRNKAAEEKGQNRLDQGDVAMWTSL